MSLPGASVAPLRGRRQLMRAACAHCASVALLPAGLSWAQSVPGGSPGGRPAGEIPQSPEMGLRMRYPDAALDVPGRFERPSADSDEGGLWAMMDREETRLRRSPFTVRNSPLARHVQDMACRLGADHCPDIRVYVVRTPLFNASMAPNGMMQIWTGLLLRVENEAQLAAVIGHEIGHYLERHSLERLRDARSRSAFAQFAGMFGVVGLVGQMVALAGMFSFSREQEARADRLGLQLMERAGYDSREASKVWDNLLGELKVTGGEDAGKRSPMFATHPAVLNRRDELNRLARASTGIVQTDAFRAGVATHRLDWLLDELRRGQFEESLVLLDRMIALDPTDSQARFARGEAFRMRRDSGDEERALDELKSASQLPGAPALVHRSLGLLHRQQGRHGDAIEAFRQYLAIEPQANDARLIASYMEEMKK